jgi:hypothetical protein
MLTTKDITKAIAAHKKDAHPSYAPRPGRNLKRDGALGGLVVALTSLIWSIIHFLG